MRSRRQTRRARASAFVTVVMVVCLSSGALSETEETPGVANLVQLFADAELTLIPTHHYHPSSGYCPPYYQPPFTPPYVPPTLYECWPCTCVSTGEPALPEDEETEQPEDATPRTEDDEPRVITVGREKHVPPREEDVRRKLPDDSATVVPPRELEIVRPDDGSGRPDEDARLEREEEITYDPRERVSPRDSIGDISILPQEGVSPTVTATASPSLGERSWYGRSVKVTIQADDAPGGPGIAAIHGRLDGRDVEVDPARIAFSNDRRTATYKLVVSGDGTHELEIWATNLDGATSARRTLSIPIDATAPGVTVSAVPDANDNGWNIGSVKVTIQAKDAAIGSSISAIHYRLGDQTTTVPRDKLVFTHSGRLARHTFAIKQEGNLGLQCWAVDQAGNSNTPVSLTVQLDRTPPTITWRVTPAANEHGWHNTAATVTFDCSDELSGIATCSQPQKLEYSRYSGSGQSVTGKATDKAGNEAEITATVFIDSSRPSVDLELSEPDEDGTIRVTITASDDRSGIARVTATDTHEGRMTLNRSGDRWTGRIQPDESGIVSVEAVDKAGNSTSAVQDYAIESPATAPEIVDGFFPTEVDYWGGGEVEGWILFRDPDGDIELVCLTLVGPSGWQGESCEDVSFEVRHKTEARRSFSFPAPYLCWEGAGEYRIELQVIDFEGLRSNVWVFEYSLSGGS